MKKLRAAVIGVGYLGSIHARIYSQLKDVLLVGVCDIDSQKADSVAKACNTTAFTDYRDLIAKIDISSVVVPTRLHYKVSNDLLENNVHLLIEKPITTTLKEANKLIELANKKNLILQVGHVERFNAAIEAVSKFKKTVRFIECHRLGPYNPRTIDTGVALDLMIHDIDIILGFINSKVKKIEAVGVMVLSPTEDIANARITFQNGAVANLTASRLTNNIMRKLRIFQDDAYVSCDYVAQSALIYRKTPFGITTQKIDIKKQDPLKKEIQHFIHCVQKGQKPVISGKEATEALSIALSITKKIQNNLKKYV